MREIIVKTVDVLGASPRHWGNPLAMTTYYRFWENIPSGMIHSLKPSRGALRGGDISLNWGYGGISPHHSKMRISPEQIF
jgi:hypothetical protein